MENVELKFDNVNSVLEEYAEKFADLYKRKLQADDKKATGNLIDSIKTSIQTNGDTLAVKLEMADYYAFVEKGRKPGGNFPPLNVIEKWIQDKRIRPENRGGGLPTQKQLAFLIGRKIAEEGIKPGNYVINTINELNDIYVEKIKEALDIDLEEYQLKVLDEISVMFGKEKGWYSKGKMK